MVMIDVTVTKTKLWCVVVVMMMAVLEVESLNGPNVCMVQQKYNITKRVKYRAPMSVRTYEWCFSMPPRCSKWKTEMRELTKLETDERIAEVAVCCPGYKMKDVSCVPICPNGKTGHRCSDDCPPNKWGPNCVNECEPCNSGICSPISGDCSCQDGWQGESCEFRMLPATSTTTTATEDLLTQSATKPTPPGTTIPITRPAFIVTTPLQTTLSSKTTLIEMTTRLNRLKILLESPISDSNKTFLLTSPTAPNKTDTLETSSSVPMRITLLETTSTLTTTTVKPTVAVKTTSPMTTTVTYASTTVKDTNESLVTTADPPRAVFTTNAATTTVPATTTSETVTSIPLTISKHTEVMKVAPTLFMEKTTEKAIKYTAKVDKTVFTSTSELTESTIFRNNSRSTNGKTEIYKQIEQTTRKTLIHSKYNRTEVPFVPKTTMHELHVPVKVTMERFEPSKTTTQTKTTDVTVFIAPILTTEATTHKETTKRPQSTIRYFPTTVKFKPKEIWIRPAQKGESFMKTKTEASPDLHSKPRDTQPTNTTPKTIIVSIIPTSVSYATFKKIALTTTSLLSQQTNITVTSPNGTAEQGVTKPMSKLTTTESPLTTKLSNVTHKNIITSRLNKPNVVHSSKSEPHLNRTTKLVSTFYTTTEFPKNSNDSKNGTNSMTTVDRNLNSSNSLTTPSTNVIRTKQQNITQETTLKSIVVKSRPIKIVTVKPRNVTIITVSGKNKNETVVKITKTIATDVEKTNATRVNDIKTNQVTTESPDDEEFHILTEPEHITAVMEGKGKEITSVDLISVISIAGGIMMAVITVAVVIVMVERCKKPRYEGVRKMSDIRMHVMMDNDDVPPPYVRSIFHTPLPDPPSSEKCHYQPISTLDRNLKQFMRPVVVQTISPIMLENFRGILECHYDHLPRRSYNFDSSQRHCSIAPSVDDVDEMTRLRPCSVKESTVEALKCEAKLDVIDSTTSEPLYAEIPCWRPPSEHAIEIMNLNGEAVTEL